MKSLPNFCQIFNKNLIQLDSPPAWMQEAYHLPCSRSKSLLFWGGGVPSVKIFFSSLNMYQAKSGVKNFSLYWGGGGVGRGGPSVKIFFPIWTCIKPNLVSKIFPFTGGGRSLCKIFFSSLNMYEAKSGVKNFSLYWGGTQGTPQTWDGVPPGPEMGYPPDLGWGTPPPGPEMGYPLPGPEIGYPPYLDLRWGTPPT